MATAANPVTYPHITETPGVRGGRPRIAGTRITVMDVVSAHLSGMPAEEIRTYFSSRPLTLAEVHSCLAYYYDHQAEVDALFEEDRHWDERHEQRRAAFLKRQAGG